MNGQPKAAGRLRIWHLVESYPPDYGGGAAITTREVCRALADRGHEVRAITVEAAAGPPYRVRTTWDGPVRVDRINLPYFKTRDPDGFFLPQRTWTRHQRAVAACLTTLVEAEHPDLVDYHATRPLGEEALLTLSRLGVPVVATLHEGWLICPRVMLLRSPLRVPCSGPGVTKCLQCAYSNYDGSHARAVVKLAWRVMKLNIKPAYRFWRRRSARRVVIGAIARSDYLRRVHEGHLSQPVRHIPLGVTMPEPPLPWPPRPRSPLRFGFLGGFQRTKGIWHLLDAAAELKREGFDFVLHVWGPEEDREAARSRGLEDRVRVHGVFAADEMWRVYREIDVAIVATTVPEPLGRVPLEAAVAGAPTIAPAVGGLTESIVDGHCGLLYRFGDVADLARQMRQVLSDPGLFQQLMQNLPAVPDTREAIAEVERLYYEVLSGAQRVSSSGTCSARTTYELERNATE